MAKPVGRPRGSGIAKQLRAEKSMIVDLLAKYHASGDMEADFYELAPHDRLSVAMTMANYIWPKMQATTVDMTVAAEDRSIEAILSKLAETSGREPDP